MQKTYYMIYCKIFKIASLEPGQKWPDHGSGLNPANPFAYILSAATFLAAMAAEVSSYRKYLLSHSLQKKKIVNWTDCTG